MDARAAIVKHGDVLLAVVVALGMSAEMTAWADERTAAGLAAGLLAALSLALRRRTPLVSFLLVMSGLELISVVQPGFDNDSLAFVATFFLTLFSLGRHARGIEAIIGGAGLVVVMASFVHSEGGGFAQADLGDIGFVAVFAGAPWAAGLALRLRREREIELSAENDELRRDQAERAARAVAEERSRIARELHDVVAHAISVTILQARGARRVLDDEPDAVRAALDAIEQTNAAALGDMRRLLAVLRDTEPVDRDPLHHAPQPSLAHLNDLVEHVRASGVPVEVRISGAPTDLPPGVDLSAYRIVQESLTNVLKHSAGARASVSLAYGEDSLTVSVCDDGIPGPVTGTEPGGGHGLIGIRERVAVIGGDVEVGPGDEGGYRVTARLPYALEMS